jgi:hypothetical protein
MEEKLEAALHVGSAIDFSSTPGFHRMVIRALTPFSVLGCSRNSKSRKPLALRHSFLTCSNDISSLTSVARTRDAVVYMRVSCSDLHNKGPGILGFVTW